MYKLLGNNYVLLLKIKNLALSLILECAAKYNDLSNAVIEFMINL